jgi:hypothetical protein
MHIASTYSLNNTREHIVNDSLWPELQALFADGEGVITLYPGSMCVQVTRGSERERHLLRVLRVFGIPALQGIGSSDRHSSAAAEVFHDLVFDDRSTGLYLLADVSTLCLHLDCEPPWLIHDGKCLVSDIALRKYYDTPEARARLISHEFFWLDHPLLMFSQVKLAIEKHNLVGFSSVPVRPVSYRNLAGTSEIPSVALEFAGRRAYGGSFGDLREVPMSRETSSWWAMTSRIVMPPLHPLFTRFDARLPLEKQLPLSDPTYLGPVAYRAKTNLRYVPPIYTPNELASLPAFDIACMAESNFTAQQCSRLIVSVRGRDVLTPFLKQPTWRSVGVLPIEAKLPEV